MAAKVTFVKSARKANPKFGIEVGDSYYWWEFRFGGKFCSKTPPRRSQLTQSKLSAAYEAEEVLQDNIAAATCPEDIKSALEDCAQAVRDVASEYEDSLSNMPEGLQEGSTGQGMQEKIDELESWADDLESAASEVESLDAVEYQVKPDHKPEDGGVSFDDLTEEGQAEMLEAARELAADGTSSCPL